MWLVLCAVLAHVQSENATANTTGSSNTTVETDPRFIRVSGYLVKGNDILPQARTFAEAVGRCVDDPDCGGFTHVIGGMWYHVKNSSAGAIRRGDEWETFIRRDSALYDAQDPATMLEAASQREALAELYAKYAVPPVPDGPPPRFITDDLLTEEECAQLKGLASNNVISTNGYHGKIMPGFYGYNIEALLVDRKFDTSHMATALRAREKVRRAIVDYFNLTIPLYHDHSHFVMRVGEEQSELAKSRGLSHAIHVDNCNFRPMQRQCVPSVKHCCAWRSHSAILYLNDEFVGGETIFYNFTANNTFEPVMTTVPRCGRMSGFSAGPENPHSVNLIQTGSRYVLAMWFTTDSTHRERMPVPDPPYTTEPATPISCDDTCPAGDPRLDLVWDADYRAHLMLANATQAAAAAATSGSDALSDTNTDVSSDAAAHAMADATNATVADGTRSALDVREAQ